MMKDRMEELLNLLEELNAEGEGGQTWTDMYLHHCGLLFILFVS